MALRSRSNLPKPGPISWPSHVRSVGLEELDDKVKAAGSSATLVPLDMKDSDGIARLALALNDRYQRLDVLVGNAGILGALSPLSHYEPKDWDNMIAVNVTANWHLIRCMDALCSVHRPAVRYS